ncbi:hypothetical protein BGY98DRAFT_929923 [Russula aff. rugulosa BPL654]|nr:hypothetical protein BGY98DRAFT_929923 [Russula aff. rugulosa BPL654]
MNRAAGAKKKYSQDHSPHLPASVQQPPFQNTICDGLRRTERTRPGPNPAAAEVLAETISENDPASPRYRDGLRDIQKDGRSIEVTEFTSSILAPTNRSWHRFRLSGGGHAAGCVGQPNVARERALRCSQGAYRSTVAQNGERAWSNGRGVEEEKTSVLRQLRTQERKMKRAELNFTFEPVNDELKYMPKLYIRP